MPPTSRDLMKLALACAGKADLPRKLRGYPSFSEIEEQCEAEYEELLNALHEDEIFEAVDLNRQQELVDRIASALPEDTRELLEELVDNHARHVWLQQEGAYYLGLAMGLRIGHSGVDRTFGDQNDDEVEDGGEDDEEDDEDRVH